MSDNDSVKTVLRIATLCLSVALPLLPDRLASGAEKGEIKPVDAWSGELDKSFDANRNRALQQVASVRLVNDPKTWKFVWETLRDPYRIPEKV